MLTKARSVAYVAGVALAVLLLAGRAAVTVRDADISDFRCFYEAARIARVGGDPYDAQTWAAAVYTDPSRVPHCARASIYPFWTALALVPLASLPEPIALAVWEGLLLLSTVGGVALLARTRVFFGRERLVLASVLWSQPLFSAIANAQFGPFVFGATALLIYGLGRGRERLATIAWLLLLIKPHLSALVLLTGFVTRSRRSMLVAAIATAALLLVTLAVLGDWPARWIRSSVAQRLDVDTGLASLWTLAGDFGLPAVLGALVAVALATAYVVATRRMARSPYDKIAVACAATLILTPYARPHDLILLVIPASIALEAASTAGADRRRALLAGYLFTVVGLPWILTLATLVGLPLAFYASIALATAALSAYALRVSTAR